MSNDELDALSYLWDGSQTGWTEVDPVFRTSS